jgi:hypothetical protein
VDHAVRIERRRAAHTAELAAWLDSLQRSFRVRAYRSIAIGLGSFQSANGVFRGRADIQECDDRRIANFGVPIVKCADNGWHSGRVGGAHRLQGGEGRSSRFGLGPLKFVDPMINRLTADGLQLNLPPFATR